MTTARTDPYSPDKCLCWPDRLDDLRNGLQPPPVKLSLVPTDLCDLACPECFYAERTRQGRPASLAGAVMLDAISGHAALGGKSLEVSGGGEPCLHPGLVGAMAMARDLGLKTALITNGTHLRSVVDEAARCSWVRVSLDAPDAATYGIVRPHRRENPESVFKRVLDAVSALRERRDALGTDCRIGIGYIVQRGNWRGIRAAADTARVAGADSIRFGGLFHPHGVSYFDGFADSAVELERSAVADLDGRDGFRVFPRLREMLSGLHVAPPDYPTCHYQHIVPVVAPDGCLYRCCGTIYQDVGRVGDLASSGGFRSLWESPGKLRSFASFDPKSCMTCRFNPQNRALAAAIAAPRRPAATGVEHPEFP